MASRQKSAVQIPMPRFSSQTLEQPHDMRMHPCLLVIPNWFNSCHAEALNYGRCSAHLSVLTRKVTFPGLDRGHTQLTEFFTNQDMPQWAQAMALESMGRTKVRSFSRVQELALPCSNYT